ncbi:MAG TPA: serine/threonine-protein kinase [Polyangia bacterium]|jgi:hypothetical protein
MIGAGQELGGYTIIKRIGGGGLGEVFLAQHRRVNRRAAVKVLLPELSQKEAVLEQFFKEARNTSLIKHRGIMEILDCDLIDGQAFVITEFLEGESLGGYLKRTGPLDQDLAFLLGAIAAVADTVEAAHLAGIMHRDLKPENIYLQLPTPTEPVVTVKVLDFGIAKLSREDGGPSQTKTGLWLASPTYMSPEQCRGVGRPDARSDIYSLGCVLYEALCGHPPFSAPGIAELIVGHATQPPKPPLKIVPDIPPKLNALILRMLAKKPDERPQTMSQVVVALRDIARALGIDLEGPLQPLVPVERPTALLGAALAGVAKAAPSLTPAPVATPVEVRSARPVATAPATQLAAPAPPPRAVAPTLERGAGGPVVKGPVVAPVIAPEARPPRALPRTLLAGADQRQAVAAGRMPEQPIEAFAGGTMILESRMGESRQPPPSGAIQAAVGGTKIMDQVGDRLDEDTDESTDDADEDEDAREERQGRRGLAHPDRTMRVSPATPGGLERMLSLLRDHARLVVIVGGGIVLVAIVTTLLLKSLTAPRPHGKAKLPEVQQVTEEPPRPVEPAAPPVEPTPPPPPTEAEHPAPPPVQTVQIDIQGIAPDTVVTVDDQPATLPVRIRRGPALHRFTLRPSNGSERTIEIDGTRDRVIELVMAPVQKPAPPLPPEEHTHAPSRSPSHGSKPKPASPTSDRKAITDL